MVRFRPAVLLVVLCLFSATVASGAVEDPLFSRPRALAATGEHVLGGDFNLDGKMDLLNVEWDKLSVLLSNGNGTFQAPRVTTIETQPDFRGLGDVNADGRPDFVTSNGADKVRVALANADGTFTHSALLTSSVRSGPVAVADFTGDGKADVLTVSSYSQADPIGVVVFPGNSNGTFGSGILTSMESWQTTRWIAIADMKEDGKMDLVFGTTDGVTIRFGNGDGTFGAISGIAGGGPIALGDFNGDGNVDCATADDYAFVTVHLGDGQGGWTAGPQVFGSATSIAAADVNGDGKLDVVTGSNDLRTSVFLGNGDGTLSAGAIYASGGGPPIVSDFTGDGKLDVAGVHVYGESRHAAILAGNGDGTLRAPRTYPVLPNIGYQGSMPEAYSLTLAEVTGDTRLDALTWTGSGVFTPRSLTILPGLAGGRFGTPQHTQLAINSGLFGDFTGDGELDIAGANEGVLVFYRGNGDGTFTRGTDGATSAWGFTSGDFNGDGKLDLLGLGSERVVQPGNGNGTFGAGWASIPAGDGSRVGDVNGDGKDDVVTVNFTYLSTGSGFTSSPPPAHFSTSEVTALVDLDGDSHLDMVMQDYYGFIQIRDGNGDGTFGESRSFFFNVGGSNPVVTEFNGDGNPDLVYSRHVLLGDGDGAFGGYEETETHNGGSLAVGDLDGSGTPDLAVLTGEDTVTAYLTRTAAGADMALTFSAEPANPMDHWRSQITFTAEADTTSEFLLRGAVLFRADGRTLGIAALDPDGKGTMRTFLDIGLHSIVATYLRNDQFTTAGATFQQQITKVPPSLTLYSSLNPARETRTVKFIIHMWPELGYPDSPTGTVTLRDGDTVLKTFTLPGDFTTMSFSTSKLPLGTHTITADYSGDEGHLPATVSLQQTITQNAPDVLLEVYPLGSAVQGATVTLKATLSPSTTPGSVTFWAGNTALGSVAVSNGVATLSTSTLPAGTYFFMARYTGSAQYSGASSPTVQYNIFLPAGTAIPAVATAKSTTLVSVSWPPVQNADGFDVYRSSHGGPFLPVGSTFTLGFTDASRTPDTTYLYRVIAKAGSSEISPAGPGDPATTIAFTNDPLAALQTTIRATHVIELRTAIAAMRVAAGLAPFAYTRTIAAGTAVHAQDFTEMRTALQQARAAMGLASPFTGTLTPQVTRVTAAHLQQIRELVK